MLYSVLYIGRREIKDLSVKCAPDNIERGCTWVGTFGTHEEHVATCNFTLLPCPKECKDDSGKVKQFMRKDLDNHLKKDCPNRSYSCEYCGKKGVYANTQEHDEMCPKKQVTCPEDGCSEKMQRQSIPSHIATACEHTVTPCKYVNIGCEKKVKRKDLKAHEQDDTVHLHMAIDKLNKKIIDEKSLKFKLTDYGKKKGNSEIVRSPSYYTSPNGYHVAMLVDINGDGRGKGTHVSVYAIFLEGNNDARLKQPFVGNISFTLLNQLQDKNHHQKSVAVNAASDIKVGKTWGEPLFIPHSALDYDPVNNTQYLKDDTLYFSMLIEPADHKPWLQ